MATLQKLAIFVAVVLAAGCATVQDIALTPTGAANSLKDREITIAVHETPDFGAMTPGAAAFGLIGAAVMIHNGNTLVTENRIEDPARAIARALSANLEQAYHTRTSARAVKSDWEDAGQLAKLHPGADMILDVQTTNWTLAYFPTAWASYRLIYVARARLVDVKRGTVVAQGMCKHVPQDSSNAPSYYDFTGNKAARVKQELLVAADECLGTASKEMFAMASPALVAVARSDTVAAAPAVAPAPALVPASARAPATVAGGTIAPFAGTWDGRWAGTRVHTLVVENSDGTATKIILSRGPGGRRGRSGSESVSALAHVGDDGALHATLDDGSQVVYRLSEDRRSLNGQWQRKERTLDGQFMRRATP